MIDRIKKPFVQLLIFAITFSPLGILKAQAADPTISLANKYEIATAGANLDSAVDSTGNTYVVYERSGNIYIAKNRGSEELVSAGSDPSIAVDSLGKAHLAYVSGTNVMYATKGTDGAWSAQIASSGNAPEIDVDSSGKAHIACALDSDGEGYRDIVYINNVSGSFSSPLNVFNNSYRYYFYTPTLKIDANGYYHMVSTHHSIDCGWSCYHTYSINYATNAYGGFSSGKGANVSITSNSLSLSSDGSARLTYNLSGNIYYVTPYPAWNEQIAASGTGPSISTSGANQGIVFSSSGVRYTEGSSVWSESVLIDAAGTSPVLSTNGLNRFIYYLKSGKIYLATDKVLYNTPVISGVEAGGIYNTSKEISWDHGDGTLNGVDVTSPVTVTDEGSYNITVVNDEGKSSSVNFSIDKTAPVITIDGYNTSLTNQDITVTASTSEGTLNAASHTFTENGSFTFSATDAAGNEATETVVISNIDKISPVIEIGIYSTAPTNQNITVTASTNEGTLNSEAYTFVGNGSFEFVASDAAGNVTTYTVTISNIDKVAPTITIDPYSSSWTNKDITVNASTP